MLNKHGILLLSVLSIWLDVSSNQYLRPFHPYYSQGGQDKYVNEKIFHAKKGGVFFEIGAHDGVSYSNTYYFEEKLGWTGVCVEPQKNIFEQLKKNRKAICVNGCVFDRSGEVEFLQVNGPSEMLSGIVSTFDSRHLERAKLEVAQLGGSLEVLKLRAYTFNDLCNQHGIKHIDLLSVDTEGSEEQIIKSIDFNRIEIDVIVVENNFNDKKIENYLNGRGFRRLVTIGSDDIYSRGG